MSTPLTIPPAEQAEAPAELTLEERELQELEAELAGYAAKREHRSAERERAELLPRKRRALADAKALDQAELDIGAVGKDILVVETDHGNVIVKRATAPAFKHFTQESSKPKAPIHDLTDKLVRGCLVYPDKGEFDRMVALQPHILTRAGNAVAELAGVRDQEVAGKS